MTRQSEFAWIDESKYYYIKVENEVEDDGAIQKRTLVLDNLIHGYFILDHPERLDYDYEHIYALVAYRAAKASGKVKFKPAPADTLPATLLAPGTGTSSKKDDELRIAPAKDTTTPNRQSRTTHSSPGQGQPTPSPHEPPMTRPKPPGGLKSVQASGDDRRTKQTPSARTDRGHGKKRSIRSARCRGAGLVAPRGREFDHENAVLGRRCLLLSAPHAVRLSREPGSTSPRSTRAVTNANFLATGLPRDTPIKTYWGDARQFVELNQDTKQYDLVFGDAFNDFSVPWHLTTREFNEKIKKMLTPNGVYMINIIDVYESDAHAEKAAQKKIDEQKITDPAEQARIRAQTLARARRYGGFLGAWTETAKLTFPTSISSAPTTRPGRACAKRSWSSPP